MINLLVIATGMHRAHVPWSAIQGQDRLFLDCEYVPIGFRFQPPRLLNKEEIIAFLNHILKRQETYKFLHQVFRFKKITAGRALKSPVIDPLYPPADGSASIPAPETRRTGATKTPYVSRIDITVNPEMVMPASSPATFQTILPANEQNIDTIQTSATQQNTSHSPAEIIGPITAMLPTPGDDTCIASPVQDIPAPPNENTDPSAAKIPPMECPRPRPRKKQRGNADLSEKEQTFYYQTIYGDDNHSVETELPLVHNEATIAEPTSEIPASEIPASEVHNEATIAEPTSEISASEIPAKQTPAPVRDGTINPPANKRGRKKTADERALEEASKLGVIGKRRSIGRVHDS